MYALREPPQSEVVCRIYAVKTRGVCCSTGRLSENRREVVFFPVTAAFGAEVVSETGAFDSLSGW